VSLTKVINATDYSADNKAVQLSQEIVSKLNKYCQHWIQTVSVKTVNSMPIFKVL